ncbi:IS30 family transposase [Cellulomonas sp. PhB150]|nr:IS30 family transposase [Cellulomonas sp. PhB150]
MVRRGRFTFPVEVRRSIVRLAAQGVTRNEIAAEVGASVRLVYMVLGNYGGVLAGRELSSRLRLTLDERVEIKLAIEAGDSIRAVARRLGRAPSTISRELAANGSRGAYSPMPAHRRAAERRRRPKMTKLANHAELRGRVLADLGQLWSPEQISARLRAGFPDRPEMRVSHETIYKSIYVQGRGELRRELAACLRTGRAQRKPQGRGERHRRIADMIMISDRPAEAGDRAVPGHWEGDLIIGKNGNSAIGTLVERSTRFVMLLHLPGDRTAATVRDAMTTAIATLPAALTRSITWDQGIEMAQHAQFSVQTGVPIYFCDPHSPWQRGSNENTNGLLRQYFPKSTDLSMHSPEELQRVADSLNGRPRQTLGWMTPSEKLNETLVAMTG